MKVIRDESEEAGYHYRLELPDLDGIVEVDTFRIHSEGQVFLEVKGSRGSDSKDDSVVVALDPKATYSLSQALIRAHVFMDKTRKDREREQPK